MKMISLTACVIMMVCSCTRTSDQSFANSLWKIRKVEIRKDNEVKKIIDTGSQFWSFKKRSLIEIFDMHRIQNILHIKMGNASIRSFDNRGSLQDEFIINKMDDNCIALHSTKTVEDAKYDIIYYLDKVKDSTAEEIKNAY